jgi:hypothetical protein
LFEDIDGDEIAQELGEQFVVGEDEFEAVVPGVMDWHISYFSFYPINSAKNGGLIERGGGKTRKKIKKMPDVICLEKDVTPFEWFFSAQGIGGMRSSRAAGAAGAIAESRKARFFAAAAKNAPKNTGA